jgi:hypothetical protein
VDGFRLSLSALALDVVAVKFLPSGSQQYLNPSLDLVVVTVLVAVANLYLYRFAPISYLHRFVKTRQDPFLSIQPRSSCLFTSSIIILQGGVKKLRSKKLNKAY